MALCTTPWDLKQESELWRETRKPKDGGNLELRRFHVKTMASQTGVSRLVCLYDYRKRPICARIRRYFFLGKFVSPSIEVDRASDSVGSIHRRKREHGHARFKIEMSRAATAERRNAQAAHGNRRAGGGSIGFRLWQVPLVADRPLPFPRWHDVMPPQSLGHIECCQYTSPGQERLRHKLSNFALIRYQGIVEFQLPSVPRRCLSRVTRDRKGQLGSTVVLVQWTLHRRDTSTRLHLAICVPPSLRLPIRSRNVLRLDSPPALVPD